MLLRKTGSEPWSTKKSDASTLERRLNIKTPANELQRNVRVMLLCSRLVPGRHSYSKPTRPLRRIRP